MRVLFILELYYPNIGGIEKLFKSLAERLAEQGHEVKVITTRFRKDLPKKELINGVEVRRLNISSRFLFTFFGIFGMMGAARKSDIIHTTSYNAAFPARLAGWISGKKVMITFHEAWGPLWFRLPWANYLSKILYFTYEWIILRMRFHKFIAVSDNTAASLNRLGVNKNSIVRIYNGLDYEQYDSGSFSPPEAFTCTYFGRLGISKGLDMLLASAPFFLKNNPGAHFKFIYPKVPGRLYRKVSRKLKELPAMSYTCLHELNYEDLIKELQSSSCVVIPSYSEGFCYAAAEAIAMGIPVISSGQGALKEVVSGKSITMPSLDPKGLTQALEKAKNGEWEDKPVRQFHFSDTVESYLKLYNS
jgi:glycosyltransferase involved in cell wall biosynthesis